jgi:hypothetical protein
LNRLLCRPSPPSSFVKSTTEDREEEGGRNCDVFSPSPSLEERAGGEEAALMDSIAVLGEEAPTIGDAPTSTSCS